MSVCAVENCARKVKARGWCSMHYHRWQRHGDPLVATVDRRPIAERLEDCISRNEAGCWLWERRLNHDGYGLASVGHRWVLVHRWSYEHFVGQVPEGLELDHLCRVRHCVNPEHLEPVTHRENVLRGTSPVAENARKTHCPKGHEYTPENTYTRPSGPGRDCRACNKPDDHHQSIDPHGVRQ